MRNPHLARLSFNYLWSNPEAGDDVLVCAALSRPNFDDLLVLSDEMGVAALRKGWDVLEKEGWRSRHTRSIAGWYLEMIENAHRMFAAKNAAEAGGADFGKAETPSVAMPFKRRAVPPSGSCIPPIPRGAAPALRLNNSGAPDPGLPSA